MIPFLNTIAIGETGLEFCGFNKRLQNLKMSNQLNKIVCAVL